MTATLLGIRKLLRLSSTSSTQTVARRLAEEGAPAWTLVWADRQSRGRGRMERRWSSGTGGLYISLILRPRIAHPRLAEMSVAFAEACAKALAKATGLKTFVKPPNDVLALADGQGGRKVCGILLEASGDTRRIHWLIAGIGVNVNNRLGPSLAHASTLERLAGRRFDVAAILKAVLREIQRSL